MKETCFVYVKENLAINVDLIAGFTVQEGGSVKVHLLTDKLGGEEIDLTGEDAVRFLKVAKDISIGAPPSKPSGTRSQILT
jgi:hypothetical protein